MDSEPKKNRLITESKKPEEKTRVVFQNEPQEALTRDTSPTRVIMVEPKTQAMNTERTGIMSNFPGKKYLQGVAVAASIAAGGITVANKLNNNPEVAGKETSEITATTEDSGIPFVPQEEYRVDTAPTPMEDFNNRKEMDQVAFNYIRESIDQIRAVNDIIDGIDKKTTVLKLKKILDNYEQLLKFHEARVKTCLFQIEDREFKHPDAEVKKVSQELEMEWDQLMTESKKHKARISNFLEVSAKAKKK